MILTMLLTIVFVFLFKCLSHTSFGVKRNVDIFRTCRPHQFSGPSDFLIFVKFLGYISFGIKRFSDFAGGALVANQRPNANVRKNYHLSCISSLRTYLERCAAIFVYRKRRAEHSQRCLGRRVMAVLRQAQEFRSQ